MEHFPKLTPAEIERTTQRLQRVARAWVDDAGARDLAQGAWLKVSAGEFTGIRKLETFLLGVVRNLARKQARSEHRRGHREQQAARPEAIASAAELAERNELAARLATTISELPEPQRTAILLRYDEGLSAVEIAENLGIPPATVRSRLKRARQALRSKLQDSNSPPGNWALFLPAWAPKPTLGSAIGVLMMSSIVKWTLAVICGLLLVFGGWHLLASNDLEIDANTRPVQGSTTEAALVDVTTAELRTALAPNESEGVKPTQAVASPVEVTPPTERQTLPDEIAGTLMLPDGTVLPDQYLFATMQATPQGGPISGTQGKLHPIKSESNGQFTFRNLQPGFYEVKVPSIRSLAHSREGLTRFKTGAERFDLVIDAILANVQALDSNQNPVPMVKVHASSDPFQDIPSSQQFASSRNSTGAKLSTTMLIPAGIATTIQALGPDSNHFIASIPADTRSGVMDVVLTQESNAHGEISVSLSAAGLPAEASLWITLHVKGGSQVKSMAFPAIATTGKIQHSFRGLIPGEYTLRARLWQSGRIGLAKRTFDLTINAGTQHSLELDPTFGGLLTVAASTNPLLPKDTWGKTELRRKGQPEWVPLVLTCTTTMSPISTGQESTLMWDKILVGCPKGISNALEPGDYEVKVTLDGHLPAIQQVTVQQDGITELEFVLNPE